VEQILGDIASAVSGGYAGAACDVEVWQDVARRLGGEAK
jgi:hypothetical protein